MSDKLSLDLFLLTIMFALLQVYLWSAELQTKDPRHSSTAVSKGSRQDSGAERRKNDIAQSIALDSPKSPS